LSYAGFADLFTSVSPNGSSSSRDVVVSGLEAAHGAYPGITVEIHRFKFIATSAEQGVARYEEWQFHPARTSARVSLVVMRRDADARHGWRWLAASRCSARVGAVLSVERPTHRACHVGYTTPAL
jgi:hypothetical protein